MSLITLCLTLFLLLPAKAAVYYVSQAQSESSFDGSKENPFTSLEDAIAALGSGVFELVLLGEECTLSAPLYIPPNSEYTIRPDAIPEGKTHYTLKLEPEANMTISESNLTLQDIQIVDLNQDQPYEESTLSLNDGTLTFNRVLVSDINYPDWGYTLILASGNRDTGTTRLNIVDSSFQDLVNVQIALLSSKLTLANTTFLRTKQIDGPLFFVYDNMIPQLEASISDVSIQNSSFEYLRESTPTNFISFYACTIDVKIENLRVQDISITNACPFIEYISEFEDSATPTSFAINNAIFENIVEKEATINTAQTTGNGLLFDIFGTTNLMMYNITVSNVNFKYASMVAYNPNTDNFLPNKILFPSATIKGFIIENSSNANLLFSILDTVSLEDVQLQNNFFSSLDLKFAQFALMNVTKGIVKNMQSTNQSGPVIRMYQVLNQEFQDCTFDGSTTSQQLPTNFQNIIYISRTKDYDDPDPYPEENMVTTIKNVNINGFDDVNGLNISKESNDTYAIIVRSEMGKVYIQDSKWSNIKMGSFMSPAMAYLEINNLIAEGDPEVSFDQTPWHRTFQFVNIGQLEVKNSAFLNNKNLNLFNFFNIRRDELFDLIELTKLHFENLNVTSNANDPSNPNGRYSSLIVVSSPLKPVDLTFTNSYFADNTISTGLLVFEECYKVDLDFYNNVFENNIARELGTVFLARDMQDEYSQIEIHNNLFRNNTCLQKGGVFGFISTKHQISATNNTYIGNSAGVSGGVGYVLKSKIFYTESNSYYSNNSAGNFGGSWYFSVSRYEGVATPIDFVNTTFEKSATNQKGGAIYIVTGSLSLRNSLFDGNKALVAGGDVYLVALSTLYINGVQFRNSYAGQGPLLYAETILDETIVIEDCVITDISSDKTDTALIQTNAGSFRVSNTEFSRISSSLFNLEGTAIELIDVTLNDINCTNSGSFCVLRGSFINLTISHSEITNVIANSDLVLLNSLSKQVVVDNVKITNVRPSGEDTARDDKLFALRVFLAEDITVRDSSFINLYEFSAIRSERSHLTVSNTLFSNLREGEAAEELSQQAQFLVLETSNVSVESCSFTANSAINDQINGGAIQINGNGGDYFIRASTFDGNNAFEGGAISVKGTIDNFAIEASTFRNNTATTYGGGLYFGPESVTGIASIKASSFEANKAQKGGAVYLDNENISIDTSSFIRNVADEGAAISLAVTKSEDSFQEGNSFVENSSNRMVSKRKATTNLKWNASVGSKKK